MTETCPGPECEATGFDAMEFVIIPHDGDRTPACSLSCAKEASSTLDGIEML